MSVHFVQLFARTSLLPARHHAEVAAHRLAPQPPHWGLLSLSTRPAMVWPHPRHFARGPFGVEVLSKPSQIASGGRPLLEDIRKLLIKKLVS